MNWNKANGLNEKVKANSVYKAFKLVFDILSKPLRDWLDRKFGK